MKELYKPITSILRGDSELVNMVAYTDKKMNIRRGYAPPAEGWNKLVLFYLQPQLTIQDFTPKIRLVPLIIRVYDREKDLPCDDMAERIIVLLDSANLTVAGKVFCYNCSYTGEIVPLGWDNNLKTWGKAIRFEIRFRII